ncbi:hypothetical protein VNO78_24007 [Psophocarpus tetragonolobus]|uniref:RRM domain-containing protein n=1 Tax=Psophocarpus tetragonolobus TaxID=3891 RepID=A0AAN9XEE3_PSOTE
MWNIFSRWGKVSDVFIPVKVNKFGKRFGFVTFDLVRDVYALEAKLDSIWIGTFKLWVNVRRFRRDEDFDGKGRRLGGQEVLVGEKMLEELFCDTKELMESYFIELIPWRSEVVTQKCNVWVWLQVILIQAWKEVFINDLGKICNADEFNKESTLDDFFISSTNIRNKGCIFAGKEVGNHAIAVSQMADGVGRVSGDVGLENGWQKAMG